MNNYTPSKQDKIYATLLVIVMLIGFALIK